MNGPEHYREAQRLLVQAGEEYDDDFENSAAFNLDRAKVHATLALAAAMAELEAFGDPPGTGRTAKRSSAWTEVMS